MNTAGVVLPVLTFLFHRLEERFNGRPTLLILDEAWVFLDNPLFAARIREWLKVLRKKNVSVVLATQTLADISGISIDRKSAVSGKSVSGRVVPVGRRILKKQITDTIERRKHNFD